MLDLKISAALQDFAESVVKGVVDNITTKRVTRYGAMNASGQAARSVKYRLTETGFEIYVSGKAVAYFDALEKGRRPSKRPPISEIKPWVILRGLPAKWKVSADSAAFLVARKIGKEGTNVFQQGGKTGIVTDFINPENVAKLKETLLPLYIAEVTGVLVGVKSEINL